MSWGPLWGGCPGEMGRDRHGSGLGKFYRISYEIVQDLLKPVFSHGSPVAQPEDLDTIRSRVVCQLRQFHSGVRRIVNPHSYPCGLDSALHQRKVQMVAALRSRKVTE